MATLSDADLDGFSSAEDQDVTLSTLSDTELDVCSSGEDAETLGKMNVDVFFLIRRCHGNISAG